MENDECFAASWGSQRSRLWFARAEAAILWSFLGCAAMLGCEGSIRTGQTEAESPKSPLESLQQDSEKSAKKSGKANSKLIHVNQESFERLVLKSSIPVIADFWAEWCGPCHLLTPILEELAVEFDGKVRFVKINVDESPVLARQFEGGGIPLMVFFRNGKPVDALLGAHEKETIVMHLNALVSQQNAPQKDALPELKDSLDTESNTQSDVKK